ncbi:mitochondrial ribosomal protein S10 isoform X2 [Tachypleus tridentatus]|uniref:mitochondrial ribosomal protein S10 isoform X2 n=1 Tax=Tachypleus tridentatus TaxID=6853 RepID=UPI003FD2463D
MLSRVISIPRRQVRGLVSAVHSSCQVFADAIPEVSETKKLEMDKLYKTIELEVRGHDPAVLKSYKWFASEAARKLDILVSKTWEPPKVYDRRTLLKSVHIYKKHRVQYEMRTYFTVIQLKYMTGSTADTYLEYIQRNLPEGVAMKVTKHAIEKVPDHIQAPTARPATEESETDKT